MSHLDTFHAVRYRGIDGLCLDRLGKVNLITGPNGVGKTSLAEAVWLFNGRFTPVLPWSSVVLHRADDDRRVHAATYADETLQAARDLDLEVR